MSKADFKYTIYFISENGKACEARSRVDLRTRPQLALWLNDPTKRSYFTTLEKARCSNYYIPSEGEVFWTIEERDGTLRVQKNKIKFVYSLAKLSKYCTQLYEFVCEVNDNPDAIMHHYINIDGTHPFFDNKEIFYNKAYAQDERYRRIREAQMDSITRRLYVHHVYPITKEYLNAMYGCHSVKIKESGDPCYIPEIGSELYYIPGWDMRSGFFDGEPKKCELLDIQPINRESQLVVLSCNENRLFKTLRVVIEKPADDYRAALAKAGIFETWNEAVGAITSHNSKVAKEIVYRNISEYEKYLKHKF